MIPKAPYNLHDYQKHALRFALSLNSPILSMPVGSGKSLTAVEWCRQLRARRVIWVVPPELMDRSKQEIEKWTGMLRKPPKVYHINALNQRRKSDRNWGIFGLPEKGIFMVAWCNTSLLEMELTYLMTGNHTLAQMLTNVRDEQGPKWAQGLNLPGGYKNTLVVFDEAQKGNNQERYTKAASKGVDWLDPFVTPSGRTLYPLASQAAAAYRIGQLAHRKLAKTASTITEHRTDIYGLLRLMYPRQYVKRLLDLPNGGYLSDFRIKYCGAFKGEQGWLVDGDPTNHDELMRRLDKVLYRVDFRDVAKYMLPMQATGTPVPRVAPWFDIPKRGTPKVLAALERLPGALKYLGDTLDKSKASLIFFEYKETAKQAAAYLGVPLITGDTKRADREQMLDDHAANGGPLVATVYSLGHGFNLQYVDAIRVAEIPIRLDLFLQSLGRGQRLNRTAPLELEIVAVRGTGDARTLDVWRKKTEQTRALSAHDVSPAEAAKAGASAVNWSAFAQGVRA